MRAFAIQRNAIHFAGGRVVIERDHPLLIVEYEERSLLKVGDDEEDSAFAHVAISAAEDKPFKRPFDVR